MDHEIGKGTILLVGYYGRSNLGDDLMCRALTDLILRETDLDVAIFSDSETAFADIVGPRVTSIPRTARTLVKTLRQSSAVIQGGGTIFHDSYTARRTLLNYWIKLSLWLGIFAVSRLLGLRVYMLGSGIVPQRHAVTRFITGITLRLMEKVVLRDRGSFDFAARRLPTERISLGNDLAFLFNCDMAPPTSFCADRKSIRHVAISLCDLDPFALETGFSGQYWSSLAEALNLLAAENDSLRVSMLNFHTLAGRSDRKEADQFASWLDSAVTVDICDYSGDPQPIIDRILAADRLIAARYHASVLGVMTGVPTLMIAYNRKTQDFASEAEVPSLSVAGIRQVLSPADWLARLHGLVPVPTETVGALRERTLQAIGQIVTSRSGGIGSIERRPGA